MKIIELIIKEMKSNGATDAEIAEVTDKMISDENWKEWIRTHRG